LDGTAPGPYHHAHGARGRAPTLNARDIALALLVAVIWGFAFVMTRIGLDSFSPAQLTALRFVIAAAPAALLCRPRVACPVLVALGLTLFTGQFLLQFFAIAGGLPPGLASVIVHTQAFFTVLFAAAALGERPSRRQLAGMVPALVGVLLIAATVGETLTVAGLGLGLGSAVSWGLGNVLLKRVAGIPMLDLMVWLSLVPPLPALALSLALDGPADLARAVPGSTWSGLAAGLYLGLVATVLAYAIWGGLLRRYPATTVAPFSLLVPFVAALSAAAVFGETFGPLRRAGMTLVLVGLALIALPGGSSRLWPRRPTASRQHA
jgi:O-acetylserine/cysteine efflux transporter